MFRTAEGFKLDTPEREIFTNISRKLGRGAISRAKIKRLCKSLVTESVGSRPIMDAALEDIQDTFLLSSMIRAAIGVLAPSYPKTSITIARAIVEKDEFNFESNIDFELLNQAYKGENPSDKSTISAPNILSNIINMRWELYRSGDAGCDIWTTPLQSAILCAKVNSFIDRLSKGQKSIDHFHEITLEGRSFRSAYATGNFDFGDILDFVESQKTQRFKKWISESKPNADLLREYDRSNSSESKMMKSLPIRAVRFLTFSMLGAALGSATGSPGIVGLLGGVAADFTLNQAEEMLFKQIKFGWSPNQWVSEAARPMLSKTVE